jgi:hypothetical protein
VGHFRAQLFAGPSGQRNGDLSVFEEEGKDREAESESFGCFYPASIPFVRLLCRFVVRVLVWMLVVDRR